MTTQTTGVPVLLCPYWARFFQRPDGHWIAYCSKRACEELDSQRPGWRDYGEFPRAERCQLGYGELMAKQVPGVVSDITHAQDLDPTLQRSLRIYMQQREVPITRIQALNDEDWDRYVQAFIAWKPPQSPNEKSGPGAPSIF